MSLVTLFAWTADYSFITNDIRVDLMKQSDPLAIIASEVDVYATTGHIPRTWSFPGLERTDYIFRLSEIDNIGNIINVLSQFFVVPSGVGDILTRDDEQIQVDVTTGLTNGNTHVTFDGTGGKPDYRGWNIVPERSQPGAIQIRDLEYTWNPITGDYDLIQAGDIFAPGEYFNIHFNPLQNNISATVSTDFEVLLKTANYIVSVNDFGKKIICEPVGDYMTLSLPSISLVTSGRALMIEVSKPDHCSVRVVTSDDIGTNGSFIACSGDSFRVYKFVRSVGVYEWRADNCDGNFRTAGRIVSSDETNYLSSIIMDNSLRSVLKYARLYEFVLGLNALDVVSYASWGTGDNKYKFSLSDGTNFHTPDRRDLWQSNSGTNRAGIFLLQMVLKHKHISPYGADGSKSPPFSPPNKTSNSGWTGSGSAIDFDNYLWFTNDGTNNLLGNTTPPNVAGIIGDYNRPNSYITNQSVLI